MSIFKKIGRSLKKVGKLAGNAAPLIATVAGGPSAGKLVGMLTKATGAKSLDEAVQVIERAPNPQEILAQVQAENFAKLEELAYQDRQGARNMYTVTSRSEDPYIRHAPVNLAYIIMIIWLMCFFVVLYLAFGSVDIPEGFKALIYTGFGMITNEFRSVTHFFFGSSEGSKAKAENFRSK